MKKTVLLAIAAMFCTTLSAQQKITSCLEVMNVSTGKREIIKEFPGRIEAPNWTYDGKWLIYNTGGRLYRIQPIANSEPQQINTDFAASLNNDHVLSFDGKQIAISHHSAEDRQSRIYTLSLEGGKPQLVTAIGPSYLHGWSPDGETLVYAAGRNNNFDIYSISATGGAEKRLTTSEALDDGPEFTPCGYYIWFNSARTGLMQLWRMRPDGSQQTQMTFDKGYNAWFPHVSPDGKYVLYITYYKGDVSPSDHPMNKNVELRIMPQEGGAPKTLTKLFGGQGTINVNSWSPDSKYVAFVSYKLDE